MTLKTVNELVIANIASSSSEFLTVKAKKKGQRNMIVYIVLIYEKRKFCFFFLEKQTVSWNSIPWKTYHVDAYERDVE